LVAAEGGFVYDADSYADDLPYYDAQHAGLRGGMPQLIVPYTLDANDMKFVALNGFSTGEQFASYLIDAFEALHAEGETSPKMRSVGLHCRIVAKPGRILGLRRFLEHIASRQGVWVARRIDIARHWLAHHPYRP
jgi:peptidoglycan/xylan/chitin deacetylase (PgdA/CDA1 family)